MVYRQTRRRKTLGTRFLLFLVKIIAVIFVAVFFTSLVVVSIYKIQGGSTAEQKKENNDSTIDFEGASKIEIIEPEFLKEDENPEEEPGPIKNTEVDFQEKIEAWARKAGGKSGVYIYDLDNDKVVADYNGDVKFSTASLYKLFVVYEGYRRLENGEWSENTKVGGTGKTIIKCLDLAIRESNSPCAESLHSMIGYGTMANIIEDDFGLSNTSARYLYSTPEEIAKMMKIFYEHEEIKNEDRLGLMKDSFLNQPKTTYDWRRGLPKGFSDKVDVYNKVGWEYDADNKYWKIYDDAAIVVFKNENRHFIVVEMTSRVALERIVELGKVIEDAFYGNN